MRLTFQTKNNNKILKIILFLFFFKSNTNEERIFGLQCDLTE